MGNFLLIAVVESHGIRVAYTICRGIHKKGKTSDLSLSQVSCLHYYTQNVHLLNGQHLYPKQQRLKNLKDFFLVFQLYHPGNF